jgi:hypothetical protein
MTMRYPTVLVLLAICAGQAPQTAAAQGVDPRVRRSEMQGHYSQLIAIHDAVVRGDLTAAAAPATELAYLSVPVGSPLAMAGFGARIRDNARRLSHETTVIGAARATTAIIRACSECHRASGAAITGDAITRRGRALPAGMADHVRAADDMLLGLLLPSDTHWTRGADRLQSSVPPAPDRASPWASDTLRHLTDRSRRATTPAARSSNYVQLLATCAECHQRARP